MWIKVQSKYVFSFGGGCLPAKPTHAEPNGTKQNQSRSFPEHRKEIQQGFHRQQILSEVASSLSILHISHQHSNMATTLLTQQITITTASSISSLSQQQPT